MAHIIFLIVQMVLQLNMLMVVSCGIKTDFFIEKMVLPFHQLMDPRSGSLMVAVIEKVVRLLYVIVMKMRGFFCMCPKKKEGVAGFLYVIVMKSGTIMVNFIV